MKYWNPDHFRCLPWTLELSLYHSEVIINLSLIAFSSKELFKRWIFNLKELLVICSVLQNDMEFSMEKTATPFITDFLWGRIICSPKHFNSLTHFLSLSKLPLSIKSCMSRSQLSYFKICSVFPLWTGKFLSKSGCSFSAFWRL